MTNASRFRTWTKAIALVWLGALVGFAIGIEWIRTRPDVPKPSGAIDLVGAGATFPYPLYRRWFADYAAASGVHINYFSIGSNEGVRLVLDGSVDFGATDRPLTEAERARATCGIAQLPTVVGAVAVAYHLPGVTGTLRLDAPTLAAIFSGRSRRWDDAPIRRLNPGLTLPPLAIRPVQRARLTGTGAAFARYLGASGTPDDAPLGVSAAASTVEGNEGVVAEILNVAGSIGAVELTYAAQARLPVAQLRNVAGAWIAPSSASVAAAAELLTPATVDTMAGLVGTRDSSAYPVVVLTRIVVDGALRDEHRGAHFKAFARWALANGAQSATEFGYAPLPEAVAARQRQALDALRPGRCALPAPAAP